MRTRIGPALAATVLAGLLAACAGEPDGGAPDDRGPTPSSPAPTTTSPGPGSTPPTPPPGRETTLTGQVVEGVEAGCKLLDTGAEQYLLAGDAAAGLEIGVAVTVRGRERPDLLSTCQQGVPFEVTEVLDEVGG